MPPLATTPRPPYYAVVFTSLRTDLDGEGYAATAERMVQLASEQPGFLGVESARGSDGVGITVSFWDSLVSILRWREHAEHKLAQRDGKTKWYASYKLRVCRVEEEIQFERPT